MAGNAEYKLFRNPLRQGNKRKTDPVVQFTIPEGGQGPEIQSFSSLRWLIFGSSWSVVTENCGFPLFHSLTRSGNLQNLCTSENGPKFDGVMCGCR
jgi:hypothetical protein